MTTGPQPRTRHRPRRPALLGPAALTSLPGSADPAALVEAAHLTANALIEHGRGSGSQDVERLVALTDQIGLDEIAHLWSERPADSLPGTLWRLYALRAGIAADPDHYARAFQRGRLSAAVASAIAGVAEPPGPSEVRLLADQILTGIFTGDLAVALHRACAFCQVISTGLAFLADEHLGTATEWTVRAADLQRTGRDLDRSARAWQLGQLR